MFIAGFVSAEYCAVQNSIHTRWKKNTQKRMQNSRCDDICNIPENIYSSKSYAGTLFSCFRNFGFTHRAHKRCFVSLYLHYLFQIEQQYRWHSGIIYVVDCVELIKSTDLWSVRDQLFEHNRNWAGSILYLVKSDQ